MGTNTTLMDVISKADEVAARHLEFILSSGEKGESATASLAAFELRNIATLDKLPTLHTELIVLVTLVQAIKDEIELEKRVQKRGK